MRGRQPRPWHADGRRPERSHQAAFPMAVAGAGSPLRRSCAALASPFIAVAPQGRVQFRFKQLLDEAADPAANPSFQGIEPVIAKKMSSLGGINRCLRVIRRHGVISVGVPTPILFAFTSWRLRHLQISTTLATPPNLGLSPAASLDERGKRRPFVPVHCRIASAASLGEFGAENDVLALKMSGDARTP